MGAPRRLEESKNVIPVVLYGKRDNSKEDADPIALGANMPPWDYISLGIVTTTETYTFKVNGAFLGPV